MNTVRSPHQKLVELWHTLGVNDHFSRQPLIQTPQPAGCLLFVGLNPSFSERGWRQLIGMPNAPSASSLQDLRDVLAFPGASSADPGSMLKWDKFAFEHYKFYRQQRSFAADVQLPYGHLDLFSCRETAQARVRSSILEPDRRHRLTEVGRGQFAVFRELLLLSKPSLIIVANALACDIFRNELSPTYSDKTGVYTLTLDTRKTPVLMSGMLNGQRALDRYSRERLFWHARKILGGNDISKPS